MFHAQVECFEVFLLNVSNVREKLLKCALLVERLVLVRFCDRVWDKNHLISCFFVQWKSGCDRIDVWKIWICCRWCWNIWKTLYHLSQTGNRHIIRQISIKLLQFFFIRSIVHLWWVPSVFVSQSDAWMTVRNDDWSCSSQVPRNELTRSIQ